MNSFFMQAALQLAREAYDAAEVPIGCVFVYKGDILGSGRNRTTEFCLGTAHAEILAIDDILLTHNRSIFKDCVVYVTVEPCVMCSYALRILEIPTVVFACKNERFGGCGSVYDAHDDKLMGLGNAVECIHDTENEQDAILLLRKFYMNENSLAPNPKKKCHRTLKTD